MGSGRVGEGRNSRSFRAREKTLFNVLYILGLESLPSSYRRGKSNFNLSLAEGLFRLHFKEKPSDSQWELFSALVNFLGLGHCFSEYGVEFEYQLEGNYLLDSTLQNIVLCNRLDKMKLVHHKGEMVGGKRSYKPYLFVRLDTETYYFCPKEVQLTLSGSQLKNKELLKKIKILPWIIGGHAVTDFESGERYYEAKGISKIGIDSHDGFMRQNEEWGKKYTVVWVFHNTQFDIEQGFYVFKRWGYKIVTKIRTGRCAPSMLSGLMVKDEFEIQYLDTFFMYNKGLEEAAGLKKRKVPYVLVNPVFSEEEDKLYYSLWGSAERFSYPLSQYISYLKEDVEGVDKLFKKGLYYGNFISKTLQMRLTPNEYLTKSQAGISRVFIKKYFQANQLGSFKQLYRAPISDLEDDVCANSNRGGLSGYNSNYPTGVDCPEGHSIGKFDISSSYPFIYTQGLPGSFEGKLYYDSVPEGENPKEGIEFIWVHFRPGPKPALKEEYSHIVGSILYNDWFKAPFRDNSKGELKENVGGTETTNQVFLCREFLDLLEALYQNFSSHFEVVRRMYFKRRYELGEVAKVLGNKKLEIDYELSKATHNTEERENLKLDRSFVKIVLNSIYGICAKRTYYDPEYYRTEPLFEEDDYEFSTKGEGNLLFSRRKGEAQSRFAGVYIAQVGRCRILEMLVEFGREGYPIPLYYDTDSIMVMGRESDYPVGRERYFPERKELGAWVQEGRFRRLYLFSGCKKYILLPYPDSSSLEKEVEKAVAFGGVTGAAKFMRQLLLTNPTKAAEFIRIVTNYNPVFLEIKNRKISTGNANQKILGPVDARLETDREPESGIRFKSTEEGIVDFEYGYLANTTV